VRTGGSRLAKENPAFLFPLSDASTSGPRRREKRVQGKETAGFVHLGHQTAGDQPEQPNHRPSARPIFVESGSFVGWFGDQQYELGSTAAGLARAIRRMSDLRREREAEVA
jgi:hypothetical protein